MKSNLPELYATVSSVMVMAMAAAVRWQSARFNTVTNLSLVGHRPTHELAVTTLEKSLKIKRLTVNLCCDRLPLWGGIIPGCIGVGKPGGHCSLFCGRLEA